MWAAEREISTNGLRGRTSEGDEALFISLAEHADDPPRRRRYLLESDSLGHAKAGAVQELDERPTQRARAGAGSGVYEALGLGGRESTG